MEWSEWVIPPPPVNPAASIKLESGQRFLSATMPPNKDRLYVALFVRAGKPKMAGLEDKYHWALITGPKDESDASAMGTHFHVKRVLSDAQGSSSSPAMKWVYEESSIPMIATRMILVRIVVGKVKNRDRLRAALRRTPVRSEVPGWNCVEWVKEAFLEASNDAEAMGKTVGGWDLLRDAAMWYVEKKKAEHRFDGIGQFDQTKVSTWDMFSSREIVP